MSPDLLHLIQLQDLDLEVDRLRRRIAEMPAAVVALDERLAERVAAVAAIKQRMEASQASRREIEKELAAVQGRLSKYKGQLMEVKTNKEYQAMQHEIQAAEQGVRAQEDKLLDQMEEAERLGSELKTAEADLKAAQGDVARDKSQLEGEQVAIDRELQQKTTERGGITAKLSAAALALFEQVAGRRKGVALSEARAGSCTQCHVRLRPQIFNEVRRMDALIQCDNCSRILYYVAAPAPNAAPQPSS
jgi:predicted  nucleic acid-binding Zn-ribbon protein